MTKAIKYIWILLFLTGCSQPKGAIIPERGVYIENSPEGFVGWVLVKDFMFNSRNELCIKKKAVSSNNRVEGETYLLVLRNNGFHVFAPNDVEVDWSVVSDMDDVPPAEYGKYFGILQYQKIRLDTVAILQAEDEGILKDQLMEFLKDDDK